MDIEEQVYRDLSYIRSLEALITLIEETAEGHPYTMRFYAEDDGPVIEITRTRPETPEEEMRRQKIEMSAAEKREWAVLQAQRRDEMTRILGNLTLEELRKCQPLTKEETA